MPLTYMAPAFMILGCSLTVFRKRIAPFFDVFWLRQGYAPKRNVIEWLIAGVGLGWVLTGAVWLVLSLTI